MAINGKPTALDRTIATVAGLIPAARLGRTLMHEHLAVGFPGWRTDYLAAGPALRDLVFPRRYFEGSLA